MGFPTNPMRRIETSVKIDQILLGITKMASPDTEYPTSDIPVEYCGST